MSDHLKALLLEVERLPQDERKVLIAHLMAADASLAVAPPPPGLTWAQALGRGTPSVAGEDAQQWVSRTRAQDEQHRAAR